MNLREVSVAEVRALLTVPPGSVDQPVSWHPDYPRPETFDGWAMVLAAHEVMGLTGRPRWWTHQIVDDGEVVGDIGFHGPPADRGEQVVEIGFDVVPARRGQGLATRACGMIIELAWRDGADRVVARTDPDNTASQKVLLHNGFTASGLDGYRIERPR